jgi:hypothetical protein
MLVFIGWIVCCIVEVLDQSDLMSLFRTAPGAVTTFVKYFGSMARVMAGKKIDDSQFMLGGSCSHVSKQMVTLNHSRFEFACVWFPSADTTALTTSRTT